LARRRFNPGNIVLDVDSAPPRAHPQLSAHVCCSQMAGWIKMPRGMEIGLGPVDIVLDGDPAPSPKNKRGTAPHFSAHVCCGQTAAWIKMPLSTELGLGPGHIVRWGLSSAAAPTIFGPCLLWPNAWMDPYGIGRDVDIGPEDCVRWGPHSPQRGTAPMSIVVKWLDVPRCHLVRR